jgi:hypothetical protein
VRLTLATVPEHCLVIRRAPHGARWVGRRPAAVGRRRLVAGGRHSVVSRPFQGLVGLIYRCFRPFRWPPLSLPHGRPLQFGSPMVIVGLRWLPLRRVGSISGGLGVRPVRSLSGSSVFSFVLSGALMVTFGELVWWALQRLSSLAGHRMLAVIRCT